MSRLISALALIALLVAALAPAPAPALAQEPIQQLRAFWADSFHTGYVTSQQVDQLVDNVARSGANAIMLQVRRHGDSWYNQGFEPRAPELAPGFDPLAYMLQQAHARGIQVHAWLVIAVTCPGGDRLRNNPQHVCTQHGPNAQGAERWTTATFEGRQIGDIDYGHPAAITYLERVVQNLVASYPDLDGLHWDYIRFGGKSYGYNQVSLDRFNTATGRPIGSRPDPNDPAWGQWRRDRVTELVRRLYIRAKAIKPTIQISAATISWGGLGNDGNFAASAAYDRLFQDWRSWLQEGILDFAMPMHYFEEGVPRSRAWYDGWLAFDRANTGRRAIVPGIGAWLNSPEQNLGQVQRALAPDAQGRTLSGVAFFSYANPRSGTNDDNRRAFMDQLKATVFAQPARPPAWPWVFAPSTGMLQGIASVGGQVAPGAKVTLIRDGQWLTDITAAGDGWFGAIELPPGSYQVAITLPDGRQEWRQDVIRPGLVTSL